VSEVTQIVVRASSQGGAAVVTGSGTTVMMYVAPVADREGADFVLFWRAVRDRQRARELREAKEVYASEG
jgi:hypothetical protein